MVLPGPGCAPEAQLKGQLTLKLEVTVFLLCHAGGLSTVEPQLVCAQQVPLQDHS